MTIARYTRKMKIVRSSLLTLTLLLPASLLAQYGGPGGGAEQSGPGHRHMPSVDDQLQHLSKKLKLTDEQKPKVKEILQDQRDQMQQLMQDSSGDRTEKGQKMREIHQNASSKIRALLTDDQKARYDKLEAERQERMEKRWHHRRGAPPDDGSQSLQ
jgi:periplasmic protein CpxP/Spy